MLYTVSCRPVLERLSKHYSRGLRFRRIQYPFQLFISRAMASKTTAGIIIIGDEITKGKVADTNSYFLARKFYSLGVDVRRISIIPDHVDDIAREVAQFSSQFTHVVTSGGIGPTHDDITYQAIAKSFDERLILLPQLVELIKSHFKIQVSKDYDPLHPPTFPWDVDTSSFDPALKMALVPSSGRLHFTKGAFPTIQVRNVFIFPGVPKYMEKCARHLDVLCRNSNLNYYSKVIYLEADEVQLAPTLNDAVKEHGAHVSFGSYPVLDHNYYRTRLTMESTDSSRVEAAHQYLTAHLPEESIVSYDPESIERAAEGVQDIISGRKDTQHMLQAPVTHAYQVIEDCLCRFKPDEICISFNGGKDCSALLHLVAAAWKKKEIKGKLRAIYIRGLDPFPEMEKFVEDTRQRYDLELCTIPGPIRSGLQTILDQYPSIKAILMGTRRSDPHASNLQAFQMTDPGWPVVMRVSPILDWSYQQVWAFLRHLSLPYCTLYDKGYTSVGNRSNTQPNPLLRVVDPETGREHYRPAYFLHDCLTERQGRL